MIVMKSIFVKSVFIFCFFFSNTASSALTFPSWFDVNEYDITFDGTLGRTDTDLATTLSGTLFSDYISNNNILPGSQWVAWLDVESAFNTEVLMTWFDSADFSVARENRFDNAVALNTDNTSSPLGGPALNGLLNLSGDFILCIHHTSDPSCSYQNTTLPTQNINYSFFIQFEPQPEPVPLPTAIVLMTSSLILLIKKRH